MEKQKKTKQKKKQEQASMFHKRFKSPKMKLTPNKIILSTLPFNMFKFEIFR